MPQEQPGVGTYTVNNNAYGKQVLSQKKTLPSPKMGTGTRDAFKRVGGGGMTCGWPAGLYDALGRGAVLGGGRYFSAGEPARAEGHGRRGQGCAGEGSTASMQ